MNTDHEENVKREFEESEGIPESVEENKVVDLGVVEPHRRTHTTTNDPEVRRINDLVGHQKLNLGLLPSAGKFYREDLEVHIRAARVGEIREFSTMNEENPKDIDDRLNNIVASCTKIMYGTQRGSYKDIIEGDRIYIILSIRELTFKEGEFKLMMPVKTGCDTAGCESQESIELRTANLQFHEEVETLGKYYDHESKGYVIQTKNNGNFTMAPPTIGVMRIVSEYGREQLESGANWDKSLVAILPYLHREWRGLTSTAIFSQITNLQGWGSTKYSIAYRLAERMTVAVKPEMIYPCDSCGAEVTVPLTFPGGIKGLFVIHDIDSELL